MTDTLVAVLIVLGGGFCAVAGIGTVRLPDVLLRMHASTKAGTLGTGLVLGGVALHFGETSVIAKAMLVVTFLLLTAPVAAHLVGRAAWRSGSPLDPRTAHHAVPPVTSKAEAAAETAATGARAGPALSPPADRAATRAAAASDPPA